MDKFDEILNFLKINNKLYTAGQPLADQFSMLKKLGIKTVINLALSTTENAIQNEAEIVTLMGMTYIQIPVDFKEPLKSDLERFYKAIEMGLDKPVFVHCMMNMRVSVFVYLYRINILKATEETAWNDVLEIWEPDSVWNLFINENTF